MPKDDNSVSYLTVYILFLLCYTKKIIVTGRNKYREELWSSTHSFFKFTSREIYAKTMLSRAPLGYYTIEMKHFGFLLDK